MFAGHISAMYLFLSFFSGHLLSPILCILSFSSTFKIPCHCQNCLCNHVEFPSDSVMCHSTSLRQIFFQLNLLPPDCSKTHSIHCHTIPWDIISTETLKGKQSQVSCETIWQKGRVTQPDCSWLQNQTSKKVSTTANKPTENVVKNTRIWNTALLLICYLSTQENPFDITTPTLLSRKGDNA